ncbi:MAG: RES family NAD+ phosphorylase, partial [Epibacterium sp.]|nr:RES family NAD+ phosphorylase [Epibacterium sp.]NQX75792.1 RES family NAD+ phosphorylase [Epibacterium sp.]
EERLARENFHAVEAALEEVIDQITDDIEATVQAGTLWYRGRIGVEERSVHVDWRTVTHVATPYKESAIGALPPPLSSAGRTNRQGVSVLYVASEIETAIAEIRPHPSHFVSVGGFRARKELRVARFDLPIGPFSSSDARLDLFALIYHIDTLLSAPIIPEERHRYAVTQLLSDILIRKGFEGVIYRSSMGSGVNLCVFDPAAFDFDDRFSSVKKIDNVHYRCSNVETSIPT